MGWRIQGYVRGAIVLESTDRSISLTLRSSAEGVNIALGPEGCAPVDCPIQVEIPSGRGPWVSRADAVTMHDVRVIRSVLETLGVPPGAMRNTIGRLHGAAAASLESQGVLPQAPHVEGSEGRLPHGGMRFLHLLNGTMNGAFMQSDRILLGLMKEGLVRCELTPEGLELVQESVARRLAAQEGKEGSS